MLKGFEEDLEGVELSDEVKQQLIDAANKRADGLVQKNEELLNKLKTMKAKNGENESAAEKLAVLEQQIEQERLTAKGNYDEALQLTKTQFEKQIEELTGKISQFEKKERDTVITKAINDALNDARVNPLYHDLVLTNFMLTADLVDGEVMIGEKSLSDAIKEWSETDQGKSVRLAPENSGGNATGGSTSVTGSGKKLTERDKRIADINKRFGKV